MNGAASGHYFENFVVGEFLREYSYGPDRVNLNFYRDSNQKEIDLVIEQDPISFKMAISLIKKSANPEQKAIRAFSVLENAGKTVGNGGIVCMSASPFPLDAKNCLIPAGIL